MTVYSLSEIATFCTGEVIQQSSESAIESLVLDSRLPFSVAGSLFVAIVGPNHDGHIFLEDLYQRGMRNFLVSNKKSITSLPEANVILVADTKDALQTIAASHRKQFIYPVLGITGSNGKTVVKEWLGEILQKKFSIVRSPRSYNSQIGVPLSVWNLESQHELAIIEAGISTKNEMPALQKIMQPTFGLLTNIGEAHQSGFSSVEEKIKEKLKLFKSVDCLFYRKGLYGIEAHLEGAGITKTCTWSTNTSADFSVEFRSSGKGTDIVISAENETAKFTTVFSDEASLENLSHCIVIAKYFQLSNEEIQTELDKLQALSMRLEILSARNGCSILNDAYSSDANSLKIALGLLNRQASDNKNQTVILSDIGQNRKGNPAWCQELNTWLKNHDINKLIGIGAEMQAGFHNFTDISEVFFYQSTADFLKNHSLSSFKDEVILVKGARRFRFEKIVSELVERKRQTVLEIDLGKVQSNLNHYRSLLEPTTKMMVMVKALSYGAGSVEISRLLQYNQVDYLCVAYTDEGLELRRAGIHLPIMVLNVHASEFAVLNEQKLEPVIYSLELLKQLKSFQGLNESNQLAIHLELDTGMHRLGFVEDDFAELKGVLGDFPELKVKSIFSHLASADDSTDLGFTLEQFQQFEKGYASISRAINTKPLKHMLNTAGIENFPDKQYDMVRLGIGLYGISSLEKIQSVSVLKSFISQVKNLKKGESVSYNRRERLDSDRKIAVVNIGYGDGLPRKCGNRNYSFFINGAKAPVIGNVNMDMCMVDLSSVPRAQVGDEVQIFGPDLPVEDLAKISSTISYEILTGISPRVKRLYVSE